VAVVCQTHPSEPAVDVCDRCARALCRHCAVGTSPACHLCGTCALAGAGVRRRDLRPAAGRRRVRDARRAVLDGRVGRDPDAAQRSDPVHVPQSGPGTEVHPGRVGADGPPDDGSATSVDWWCDAEPAPGSWSQRF